MKIGWAVRIVELKVTGRVIGMFEDGSGKQFNVRYFWNGEPRTVYFFSDEIELLESPATSEVPGFNRKNKS